MAFTREQALQRLADLKAAPVFLDSYSLKRLPEQLDVYFGPPDEFFIAADTQEPYTNGRMVPILDDGNFGIVTFCDPLVTHIVQIDVESPGAVLKEFANWQQYLADLLIRVGESTDDDERVRRIANLVGFQHSAALFEFFANAGDLPHDEYHRLERRFVAGIFV